MKKMMEISEITALIMSLAPTISAVIGIIVSIAVGIKRIKQSNTDTLDECRKQNAAVVENVAQIAKDNAELRAENEELKALVEKTLNRLNRVKEK
jgi:cell shape-determining protein MreC